VEFDGTAVVPNTPHSRGRLSDFRPKKVTTMQSSHSKKTTDRTDSEEYPNTPFDCSDPGNVQSNSKRRSRESDAAAPSSKQSRNALSGSLASENVAYLT
jgi:hypothetical protein